jgi:hypothetical protein
LGHWYQGKEHRGKLWYVCRHNVGRPAIYSKWENDWLETTFDDSNWAVDPALGIMQFFQTMGTTALGFLVFGFNQTAIICMFDFQELGIGMKV